MESSDNPNNALIKGCLFHRNTERLSGVCRLRNRLYFLNTIHYFLRPQQLQAEYGDPLLYIREVFCSNSTKDTVCCHIFGHPLDVTVQYFKMTHVCLLHRSLSCIHAISQCSNRRTSCKLKIGRTGNKKYISDTFMYGVTDLPSLKIFY